MMTRKTPDDTPDIFQFLDYRAYLEAWFEARKAANPRFSHRLFARLAGHRSPSLLLHIIRGERNMGPKTLEGFTKALKLDRDEAEFFKALVDLDQASTDDERNEAWSRISAQRRFIDARRIEGDGFRYLSHWYYPAIRELAAHPDFRADPDWVAATLRPEVSRGTAEGALGDLMDMGMLVAGADGRVRPTEASVVTPPEVADLAACNYHREMAQRGHDSVATFGAAERHLLALTVGVPEDLVPVLKEELNRLQARLLDLCDSADRPMERVYQINFQLFPLSRRPGES